MKHAFNLHPVPTGNRTRVHWLEAQRDTTDLGLIYGKTCIMTLSSVNEWELITFPSQGVIIQQKNQQICKVILTTLVAIVEIFFFWVFFQLRICSSDWSTWHKNQRTRKSSILSILSRLHGKYMLQCFTISNRNSLYIIIIFFKSALLPENQVLDIHSEVHSGFECGRSYGRLGIHKGINITNE